MESDMKAVILVAGMSRRLNGLNNGLPKCLLPVKDKTIFDLQIESLKSVRITEIVLVVGYQKDLLKKKCLEEYPEIRWEFVENLRYAETNTSFSLLLARDALDRHDFFYLNGDVMFDKRVLLRLSGVKDENSLAVVRKDCGEEEVKVMVNQAKYITAIGKQLDPVRCTGEFIGVAKFGKRSNKVFFDELAAIVKRGDVHLYFESALGKLIEKFEIKMIDVSDLPCVEVDFPEDYFLALSQIKQ
jgi:choline kinase